MPGKGAPFRNEGIRARMVDDAKFAKAVAVEVQKLVPPSVPKISDSPERSMGQKLLGFVERPMFTMPIGIVGGIVALLYWPFWIICGVCVVLAFHNEGVVKGKHWLIQTFSHLLLISLISLAIFPLKQITDNTRNFGKDIAKQVLDGLKDALKPQPEKSTTPPSSPTPPPLERKVSGKNDLQLLEYDSLNGGLILNNSDDSVFVINIVQSVASSGGGEQSVARDVNIEVGPHKSLQFKYPSSGNFSTLNSPTDNWEDEWSRARATLGNCVAVAFLTPSAASLKMVENHYQVSHKPLPVGSGRGILSYTIRGQEKTQEIPLKTLLMQQVGCVNN